MTYNGKHIIIDLETLGKNQFNSVILSIGAVVFDFENSGTYETFYRNIDIDSSLDIGLNVDSSTILWWMNQDPQAIKSLQNNKVHINEALISLSKFIKDKKDIYDQKNIKIWGNGSIFDIAILTEAFRLTLLDVPWKFFDVRDVRTLADIDMSIKHNVQQTAKNNKNITLHNALDDCYIEIEYMQQIYNKHLKNLKYEIY